MTDKTSPRARFGIRFSLLARRWRQALDQKLAQSGLSDATWLPLVHLHENGDGITQKALAALMGIDSSSLVRLLDILSRDGLIERRTDPTDARAKLVYLTPDGMTRLADIRRELSQVEEILLADVGDGDIEIMLTNFEKIAQSLSDMHDERTKT